MNKFFIWLFLLVIGNSILFSGNKEYGISVVLFIIPLLIFLIYVFKEKNLIKNKYGLLLAIPIILLSFTYFIFRQEFFRVLNSFVIPGLFILMYIVTIKGIDKIKLMLKDFISIIFMPLGYIGNIADELISAISPKLKISDNVRKMIKSAVIIIPIIFIVLVLLSKADMIFSSIFSNLFEAIDNIFEEFDLISLFCRGIRMILLFTYLSVTIYFIVNHYSKEETAPLREKKKDNYTIKLLLTALNVVYILFDIIQIKSLIFQSLSSSINYAEYARQGFFELLFVSLLI